MVSACPYFSNSTSPFIKRFGDCSECTYYNWYHRHIHVFSFLASFDYLFLFSLSFIFTLWSATMAKITIRQVLLLSSSLLLYVSLSHPFQLVVFDWNLSDSKSHQVSRTLLSILAHLHSAVVWIVSILLISTSLFSRILDTHYNWYYRNFHIPQFFEFASKIQILFFF